VPSFEGWWWCARAPAATIVVLPWRCREPKNRCGTCCGWPPARPRGLHPVIDPLEGKRRASVGVVRAQPATGWHKGGEVRVGPLFQFPAEDLCIEATERQRVGAVEDGRGSSFSGWNRIAHERIGSHGHGKLGSAALRRLPMPQVDPQMGTVRALWLTRSVGRSWTVGLELLCLQEQASAGAGVPHRRTLQNRAICAVLGFVRRPSRRAPIRRSFLGGGDTVTRTECHVRHEVAAHTSGL